MKTMPLILILGGAASLAACGGSSSGSAENPVDVTDQTPPQVIDEEQPVQVEPLARVRFIAMGDSGSGSAGQFAVGRAMAQVCERKAETIDGQALPGCEFVLGFGDNIYEDGVDHVYDPQFEDKFELPFAPVDLPFYMVLGNHDTTGFIGGDATDNSRGDFQVDYHYRDDRLTDRWQMPDRYYRFTWGETRDGSPLMEFFGLDSNQIAGGFADANFNFSYQRYGLVQLAWAKESIRQSEATFKVAMAHHPYLSNGLHGNAGNYDAIPGTLLPVLSGKRWRDFIEEAVCDQTDFFMSGHDHDLQQLKPIDRCGRTEFVVSGAAGKFRTLIDEERNPVHFQQGDVYGFFWMEAIEADPVAGTPARMCTEAYAIDPADVDNENLVVSPVYSHCYDQQPLAGLNPPNQFSSVPFVGPALQELAGDSTGFDALFTGPLNEFQSSLTSGLNIAASELPDGPHQEAISALIGGIDTLFNGLDALSALLADGDDDDAAEQVVLSIIEAANVFSGVDTEDLPAPFNQLGAAFDGLAQGVGGIDQDGSSNDDLVVLAGPLLQLARNIENLMEGLSVQTQEVPVLAGITRVIGSVSQGLALSLAEAVNLDSSAAVAALIGQIQNALDAVASDVLLLDMFAEDQVATAQLPGKALSTGLLLISREIAAQLDLFVLSPLDELLKLLSPITGALRGLLPQ